ncbi:hypothetical protein MRY87_03435 [bacterium]|nr:hypothetical protein [bacterium]
MDEIQRPPQVEAEEVPVLPPPTRKPPQKVKKNRTPPQPTRVFEMPILPGSELAREYSRSRNTERRPAAEDRPIQRDKDGAVVLSPDDPHYRLKSALQDAAVFEKTLQELGREQQAEAAQVAVQSVHVALFGSGVSSRKKEDPQLRKNLWETVLIPAIIEKLGSDFAGILVPSYVGDNSSPG